MPLNVLGGIRLPPKAMTLYCVLPLVHVVGKICILLVDDVCTRVANRLLAREKNPHQDFISSHALAVTAAPSAGSAAAPRLEASQIIA